MIYKFVVDVRQGANGPEFKIRTGCDKLEQP